MVDPTCGAQEQLKLGTRTMRPFAGALPMLGVSDATKAAVRVLVFRVGRCRTATCGWRLTPCVAMVVAGSITQVESTVWEFLDAFNVHLQSHRYFLGANASLIDFALMGPLYAHMYRDPVPGYLMKTRTPFVADWVDRLRGLHEPREQPHMPDDDGVPRRARDVGAGSPSVAGCGGGAGAGAYCPPPLVPCAVEAADEVPETALPMIAMALREQLPIIRDTARALTAYRAQTHGAGAAAGAGEDVPRFIGRHEFTIGGARGEWAIQPFVLWMHQRTLDDYVVLGDTHRRAVDALLEPLLPRSAAASGAQAGRDAAQGSPGTSKVHQALHVSAAARVARVENRLVLGGGRSKL